MRAAFSSTRLEHAILLSLKQGDRNRGELFDATGQPYNVLIPMLEALQKQGKIETYFCAQDHLSVLTYRLCHHSPPTADVASFASSFTAPV